MFSRFSMLWADDRGQDLAEYAMLVSLIAIVVIAAITTLGTQLETVFTDVTNVLSGVAGGS